ncbi:MAG: glycosyltransferase family 4 protein [Crocinitomicaceae bacterium]
MQGFEKVLIIGKVWPEPKSSAAGIRMMQLIDFFQKEGTEIVFASTANESDFQEKLTIQAVTIQLNSDSFDDFILELKPNAVIFDRFMTEEQFGWRVMEKCPDAIRILNSEDLHCLRFARQESIKIDGTLNHVELFNEKAFREVASIYRCDISLMVSDREIDLLTSEFGVPKYKLYYLPLCAENKRLNVLPFSEREDYVFIGNFLHEPNLDALRFLKTDIWPLIRAKKPDAILNVYGAYPSLKVTYLHNAKEGFLVHGRAEDALEVIGKASVCLVPVRFGAGIKGKILDAMQVGTPVVTTSIGAEAMSINNKFNGRIADDVQNFANAAVELSQNEVEWKRAQQTGFEIISTKFLKETYYPLFKNDLEDLILQIQTLRKRDFTSLLLQQQSVLSTKYMSKWIEAKNKKN